MDGLTVGRMVHFVTAEEKHRPAIVVHVWNKEAGTVNLVVFLDGSNDMPVSSGLVHWMTSVPYSEAPVPYSWHWIEKA